MKLISLILLLLSLISCSLVGVRTTNEPAFKILQKDNNFQLRQYDAFITAETSAPGSFDESSSITFRRLLKYITGNNTTNSKISMTAPVLEKQNETISTTSPVFANKKDDKGSTTMSFVLPSNFTLKSTPIPSDPLVSIKENPSNKVATLRFSGVLDAEKIKKNSALLSNWISEQKFEAISLPVAAGYDPPWTVPALRRNEIHIEVK